MPARPVAVCRFDAQRGRAVQGLLIAEGERGGVLVGAFGLVEGHSP